MCEISEWHINANCVCILGDMVKLMKEENRKFRIHIYGDALNKINKLKRKGKLRELKFYGVKL